MRSSGRRVYPGSLGQLRCALWLLGSSGDPWFIGVRSGDRRVHPGSLGSLAPRGSRVHPRSHGSLGCDIRGSWVRRGAPWGSSGSSNDAGCIGVLSGVRGVRWGRWVHWDAPRGSSGSAGVSGLIRVRSGGCQIHPSLLGSLGYAPGVVGFNRCRWVHRCARWSS